MMLIQSPSAETCRSYVGKHVCAVLKDGTQVYGTIKGVSDHGLELGDAAPRATILSTNPGKASKQLSELQQKAKTSSYPGYGPYGRGYGGGYGYGYPPGYGALAWTSIALLFLIPFLFI
ncbi:hypothetical protein [Paenibacillus sp. Y412MC10]|uniref:hypothetical protein n=1 Tax=Geobacillus sp. (strain Y412MC10) TaxID=481743 RepID=UPI0021B21669|nr:hypothetical protein [Paenibacillus sp. Y412MC10]